MAKSKLQTTETETIEQQNVESLVLETRKVKALEKIANSLDALTIWFEEIPKKEWGERIAFYLYEHYNMAKGGTSNVNPEQPKIPSSVVDADTAELPVRKPRPKKDIETV